MARRRACESVLVRFFPVAIRGLIERFPLLLDSGMPRLQNVNLTGGNKLVMAPPANRAAGSRAVSSLLDQAMATASNGLIILAVARVSSVDAFGTATVLFAFAAAATTVARGAMGTPIMLAAGRGHGELRREAGFATTTAMLCGFAVSGAAAVSSILLGVPKMGAAFALAIPLVVGLDVLRCTLISISRPHVAMWWDALWAAGSVLVFAITILRPHALNDVAMVTLWAVISAFSLLGMASNLRLRPRFRGIGSWLRETYGSRIRYGLEAGMHQVKVIIITSIATAMVGAFAAASIRGAWTLLSPLSVLFSALPLLVIPEAVRSDASLTVLWRRLCWIGLAGSLLVITIGPSLALLPDRLGEFVLGESWNYARAVLPIVSIEFAAVFWISTAMIFLRFQAKSGPLLAATTAFTVISIVLCISVAFLTHTSVGVAWSQAASAVLTAIVINIYARPARPRGHWRRLARVFRGTSM